jgi:hypothetical protein
MKKIIPFLCLFLFGCSTTQVVQMNHERYTGQKINNPVVAIGQFSDYRKHASNWLGAIRGGYGNPLKTLETPKPVKDIIRDAFQDALKQREIIATLDSAKYLLNVDVLQYDCNQVLRKEAHIKLDVKVIDVNAKQQVFSDRIVVDNVEGSLLSMKTGIFASIDELKALAEKTLLQAINDLFSNPNFIRLCSGS